VPRRYLSPSVARDKLFNRIAALNEFAALLYLMALPQAADDCTLPTNDPEELLTTICPGRRDKDPSDVAAAIALLTTERDERGHTLLEYGPDGRLRYPPASFYAHQTYIAEGRRTSPPPATSTGTSSTAPESAQHTGASESLPPQQNSAEIADSLSLSTPFPVSDSSKSASNVPPPARRGGVPVPLRAALGAVTPTPNALRARSGTTPPPSPQDSLTDERLCQSHPGLAHYVFEAERKLGATPSRAGFLNLALQLDRRGALTAIWPRALGLTTEQQNARNRGALFRATVKRLCTEQGIDLAALAPAPRAA
jgi:hypothetical protein